MKHFCARVAMLAVGGLMLSVSNPPAVHAGDPIPGVDVHLEQIPGGEHVRDKNHCRRLGGKVVKKGGRTYCALRKKNQATQSN